MALVDEIRCLAERTQADLVATHDHYAYTKRVWRLIQELVNKEGRTFTFRNPTTGTRVGEQELLEKAQVYVTDYLPSSTFQHLVSLFEVFFFELLRLWLVAHPESLAEKTVTTREVLKAPDKRALVLAVVEKELKNQSYEGPKEWFEYLTKRIRFNLPPDVIEKLIEIKASRDILAHNNGIANATYVRKAGAHARHQEGEKLEIPERYLRESWETIKLAVGDVSTAAITKSSRSTPPTAP